MTHPLRETFYAVICLLVMLAVITGIRAYFDEPEYEGPVTFKELRGEE